MGLRATIICPKVDSTTTHILFSDVAATSSQHSFAVVSFDRILWVIVVTIEELLKGTELKKSDRKSSLGHYLAKDHDVYLGQSMFNWKSLCVPPLCEMNALLLSE